MLFATHHQSSKYRRLQLHQLIFTFVVDMAAAVIGFVRWLYSIMRVTLRFSFFALLAVLFTTLHLFIILIIFIVFINILLSVTLMLC